MNTEPRRHSNNEEPEITQEEDVPVDGRDHDGEKMMQEVKNERLSPAEDKTEEKGKQG
jgi:hypothetical protein